MSLPGAVTIVEVGPRDGLQNEPRAVPASTKIELIERLACTGLQYVEATSFVNPRIVPQMGDASEVLSRVQGHNGVTYPVLVPNMQGYDRARDAGALDISVFTAASETFNQRNVNASIEESIERFRKVVIAAHKDGVKVRAYISTAFGCPYEGEIAPAKVHEVARQLLDIGVDALSISDTIGVAVPAQIAPVCTPILEDAGRSRVGLHLHDTRGTALANVWEALQLGISTFDSSIAGLGGCPFADGATGNLATEDLVWFLDRNGIDTGVDLEHLIAIAKWISELLDRPIGGHVAQVRLWRP